MNLSSNDQKLICGLIRKYFPQAKIYFFGSRQRRENKPFSDLDLCIDAGSKLDLGKLSLLEEELSRSDLLYKVDISDWHRISPDFKTHILESHEAW